MAENRNDLIPEQFKSAEEAGEFWDTHSAADYWNEMEEVEVEFNIQKRVFLIPISRFIHSRLSEPSSQNKSDVETFYAFLVADQENIFIQADLEPPSTLYQIVQQQQTQLQQYQTLLNDLTSRIEMLETNAVSNKSGQTERKNVD